MWPLFCNEVGLSYDQEEKVRTFQRALLLNQDSWLDRHTAFASGKVVQSAHDATQALSLRLGQKERSTMGILSEEQRIKFATWASRNRDRVAQAVATKAPAVAPVDEKFKTSPQQHVAVNLYIINHLFKSLSHTILPAAPLVTGAALKKLSRRPAFESLGCSMGEDKDLSREDSFASSGSLKRSSSELSMEGGEERPQVPTISPQDAQATAAASVEQVLGALKEIIPKPPTPVPSTRLAWDPANFPIPDPSPVSASWMPVQNGHPGMYQPMLAGQVPPPIGGMHQRTSSFLPPHLNVVPEDMWTGDAADDFLMTLADEDWAIGEGIDMDMI